MKVTNGQNVSVHYKGTLKDGTEFDNSRARGEALNFTVGSGQMISGFNNAVVGMTIGEKKSVTLAPEDAYGPRDEKAFNPVPRQAFGEGFQFEVGRTVQGNGPMGMFLAKIYEIQDESIILDMNHPLAGEELNFDIEVVSIESDVPQLANWSATMKKAELLEVARSRGLSVNTRSTKAQIIEALSA